MQGSQGKLLSKLDFFVYNGSVEMSCALWGRLGQSCWVNVTPSRHSLDRIVFAEKHGQAFGYQGTNIFF